MKLRFPWPFLWLRTGFGSAGKNEFPIHGVGPIDGIFCEDEEESQLLRNMAQEAQNYLQSFTWCKEILEAYFGGGYGGIVAVFLFRISPSSPEVDEWLWVVVGDLPPAYLVIDASKTPSQALKSYIREMSKWVEAAKRGSLSANVIPVNMPRTWENAEALEERLRILEKAIVPAFEANEVAQT